MPRPTLSRTLAALAPFLVLTLLLVAEPSAPAGARVAPATDPRTQARAFLGPVIVAAGDIARPGSPGTGQRATARLIGRIRPAAVLTLGDNQYDRGALADYRSSYDPTWGRYRAKTFPVPGNHDHYTPGASGYFDYFGARTHGSRGWYAFDLGRWHLVALDSGTGGRPPAEEVRWLRRNLQASDRRCQLAYFHHPRWSSGEHGSSSSMAAFWTVLQRFGVDVVLNGHDHDYERFARMRPDGSRSLRGIREFVVGTGGAGIRGFNRIARGSQVRIGAIGVLKMRLMRGAYRFAFVTPGGRVRDRGVTSCH